MNPLRILALSILTMFACSTIEAPFIPTQPGVEQEMAEYVKDYKELAAINGITFEHEVTMGFTDINRGVIIGLCTYGITFRQIDIDITYWRHATQTSKMALMYHELTHCYCDRSHDWAKDKNYTEKDEDRLSAALTGSGGYYTDGCPVSIMHPIIVDDSCTLIHYNDYIKEMFNRCDAF